MNIDNTIRDILEKYDFNKIMKLINIEFPNIKVYEIMMYTLLLLEQSKDINCDIESWFNDKIVIQVNYSDKYILIHVII